MEGLNEEDFIDENTMPKLKENTINPIMGTGEDNREDYVTDRTTRLMASSSFFGCIIASSYLPVATAEKRPAILIYKANIPKSAGE